jgi:hypothetical protein
MLAMTSAALPARTTDNGPPPARRLVLVPASGRGDELVRRYRLARLRLEGREAAATAARQSSAARV